MADGYALSTQGESRFYEMIETIWNIRLAQQKYYGITIYKIENGIYIIMSVNLPVGQGLNPVLLELAVIRKSFIKKNHSHRTGFKPCPIGNQSLCIL